MPLFCSLFVFTFIIPSPPTYLIPPPIPYPPIILTQCLGGTFSATNEAFDFSTALKPGGALYTINQMTATTGTVVKEVEKEREEREKELAGKDRARATAETR